MNKFTMLGTIALTALGLSGSVVQADMAGFAAYGNSLADAVAGMSGNGINTAGIMSSGGSINTPGIFNHGGSNDSPSTGGDVSTAPHHSPSMPIALNCVVADPPGGPAHVAMLADPPGGSPARPVVADPPGGLPHDLVFTNKGEDEIPAGTRIKFRVTSTGEKGFLLLKIGIHAGARVKVLNVLDGVAKPGTPCSVSAL